MQEIETPAAVETPATELWTHIFGDVYGLLQIFTGVRSEGGKLEELIAQFFEYPETAASAEEWALRKSDEGREVYFCAHLLNERRRLKDNAAGIRALWSELDAAPLPNGNLTPTATVESSPGHFHAYWRLGAPLSPETAEQLNRRLTNKIGGDPSGVDLTQLLRVPGTKNYKYSENPTVRILSIANRSYLAADLNATLPEIKEPEEAYNPQEGNDERP